MFCYVKKLCEQLELDIYESIQPSCFSLTSKVRYSKLHQVSWINDVNMKPKVRTYKLFKDKFKIKAYIACNLHDTETTSYST